jgi:hypothetical protein
VLIEVIRLAFWEVAFMVAVLLPDLVVLLPSQSWVRILGFEFLKELHQPVNQFAPAANDMETAFVLMLFQDFVQSTFQFSHTAPPQLGSSNGLDGRGKPRSKLLRLLLQRVAIPQTKKET